MTRYYNTVNKIEEIDLPVDGNGDVIEPLPTNVVGLDDSNPFFSPLPDGQQLTYDGSDIPDGTEAIPVIPPTSEEQAIEELKNRGITRDVINESTYLNAARNDSTLLDHVETNLIEVEAIYDVPYTSLISSMSKF